MVLFAHLLILEYPDHHKNLISSSLYYPRPLHKISSQSVHNFLSNVHRQTNKQTRSTQRVQTSLAEADHYSHILHTVKMLSQRFWIITCTTIWICYHYYGVFLLIYSSYNTQITTKI